MPGRFTEVNKHATALTSILIPKGETKRLHLVDVKARIANEITFTKDSEIVQITLNSSPFDGSKGIWTVDLKTTAKLGTVAITANHSGIKVASLKVEVFEKILIELPKDNTDHGLLTRLLLAESINPGSSSYDKDKSKQAMQWMRLVINNRLQHSNPGLFAAPDAKSISDIIKAKGQFHGFEQYPNLNADIKNNITAFLKIANDYNDSRREKYAQYVRDAIAAASANGLKNVSDPSPRGLYGWRTQGSSAPGGSFEKYQDLAGQTFYTLKSKK